MAESLIFIHIDDDSMTDNDTPAKKVKTEDTQSPANATSMSLE